MGVQHDDRAQRIARHVDGKLLPRLAPSVERLADRLDRGSVSPILLARPAPGYAPLCPATRKVLAFDRPASAVIPLACLVVVFGGSSVVIALLELAAGHWQVAVKVLPGAVLGILGAIGCPFMLAGRLRELRRVLARCVVVPARVASATPVGGIPKSHALMIECWYEGVMRHHVLVYTSRECELLGWTPDLLVDTQDNNRVLLKDFYV
jgi:hypothetical protein